MQDYENLIQDYENGSIKDLIALYLGRGAASEVNDPRGALAAYTRVTQLSPGHSWAHNECGKMHLRLGDMTAAKKSFETVLTLAEAAKNDGIQAAALGNLGVVAATRGDFAEAEAYYKQSLKLNQELGHKEEMAGDYHNFGVLAEARGDLAEAERYYEQALKIDLELQQKSEEKNDE